jgi:hypothetical protein
MPLFGGREKGKEVKIDKCREMKALIRKKGL